jgi:cytochrome c biogenesis protein CcmG/thiol:disulfide interchange protein DsbE
MASTNDTAAWVEQRLASLESDLAPEPNPQHAWTRLARRRQRKSAVVRRVFWIGAASAAACLILTAFPAPRVFAARCVAACAIEGAKVSQFVLSSFSQTRPSARVLAPDFTLSDSSGAPVRLSDFRGKVVLLNFWATWCAPCLREIPWFIEFQRSHPDLVILGVSLDDKGWAAVQPFAAQMHINYRLAMATPDLIRAYGGLRAVPATFIVDRSGRIAAVHIGLISKTEYQAGIESALKETQP